MSIENFKLLKNFKDYRYFWSFNLLVFVAIWMQTAVTGIYMSQLTSSEFLIAMTQVCATLPVVLISLPLALVADSFQPYKFIFFLQLVLCFNALVLGIFALHFHSPHPLLFFAFVMGLGSALFLPIGMSEISKTVPENKIKLAAILSNWGFNFARVVGPVIAGCLFVYTSPFLTYLFIAAMFALSSIYFYLKSSDEKLLINPISIKSARERLKLIKADIKNNHVFKITAVDSFIFFMLSTAVWAFLPYYTRYQLHLNAQEQSMMVSMIGIGAILSATIMPYLRINFKTLTIQIFLMLLSGASIFILGMTKNILIVESFLIIFGFAWAATVSLFNGEIQANSSTDSRTRLIAVYFFIMYMGLTIGNYLSSVGLTIFSLSNFCFLVSALCLMKSVLDISRHVLILKFNKSFTG